MANCAIDVGMIYATGNPFSPLTLVYSQISIIEYSAEQKLAGDRQGATVINFRRYEKKV